MINIETVDEVTVDLAAAFARLIPQLSKSSPPPGPDELAEILSTPGTTVFIARDDENAIVGTTTLVCFRIPTGLRARIEDVVVDEAAGRQGVGSALTQAAIERAGEMGARTVDLTSSPSREVANHMYKRLGFELRETNTYRFEVETD